MLHKSSSRLHDPTLVQYLHDANTEPRRHLSRTLAKHKEQGKQNEDEDERSKSSLQIRSLRDKTLYALSFFLSFFLSFLPFLFSIVSQSESSQNLSSQIRRQVRVKSSQKTTKPREKCLILYHGISSCQFGVSGV